MLSLSLSSTSKKDFLVFLAGLVLGLMVISIPAEHIMPVVIVAAGWFLAAFFILLSTKEDERGVLIAIFSVAFFIRLFLSLQFFLISFTVNQAGLIGSGKIMSTPGFLLYNDSIAYSINGWHVLQTWLRGAYSYGNVLPFSATGTISPYDEFNAIVYFFTGHNPLALFFVNSLAGAVTVIPVYLLAKNIFSKKAAIWASVFCAFWPSHILWSTQNLKEPITIMLTVLCIWFFSKLKSALGLANFIYFVLTFFLLFKFRIEIAVVVALSSVLSYILSLKSIKDFVLVVLFILAAYFIFKLFIGRYFFGSLDIKHVFDWKTIFLKLDVLRECRGSYGVTGFMPMADLTSFGGIMCVLPVGLFYMLFMPVPWQFQGGMQFFASLEMLAWYISFPFMAYGFFCAIRNKWVVSSSVIVFVVLLTVIMSIIESNVGSMYRHRAIVWIFCFIFTSGALVKKGYI